MSSSFDIRLNEIGIEIEKYQIQLSEQRYNQVAGWVGLTFVLALGFLAGIVLGPFAIYLFLEVRRRDRINKKYHAENGG